MLIAETDRLILRSWQESDRAPFARLNADPRVMEFLPGPLSTDESDRMAERIEAHFRQHGFTVFAAERKQTAEFAGFIGLAVPEFEAHFTPCVEIGWRLAAAHWGTGLATEGARAIVRYAFETLQLERIVSFTVPANVRSRRVMEKLGMSHDPAEDFDHPRLPDGDRLKGHVLYRLTRPSQQTGR
jgi:RimJ/RimL family protein N-acetyltransferase